MLAIEDSLEKARYIGGFPAERNDLNYMIKLLLATNILPALF